MSNGHRHILVALVALLVLLSGCAGFLDSSDTETSTPTDTSTDTPRKTETATATTTPSNTPTPTETPIPTTTFWVSQSSNQTRAKSHVQEAISAWQQSSHDLHRLEMANSEAEADVQVEFKPTIERCEGESTNGTFFWCYDGFDTLEISHRYISNQTREYTLRGVGFVAGIDEPKETAVASEIQNSILKDPFVESDPVQVSLVNRDGSVTESQQEALNQTLDYWNENSETYGVYTVTFKQVSPGQDADITVSMIDNLNRCAEHTDAVGCAPLLDRKAPAQTPITVQIENGYTQENTTTIMKHEFGHVLGLTHEDDPQSIMSATTIALSSENIQNLNTRSYGFQEEILKVYINYESFDDAPDEQIKSEVIDAIEWYEDGNAEATPEGFKMQLVESEEDAQLVVRKNRTACSGGYEWCTLHYSTDLDTDPAYEYYTKAYINLYRGTDDEVAYNFAKGAGFVIANAADADDAPPRGISDYEKSDWPED